MKIYCPECGTLIVSEDINLDKGLAKCRQCQNLFSISDATTHEAQRVRRPAGGSAMPASTGPLLARPRRMSIEEWAGTWAVSWRWFSPVYIFLTFFCVAWDSFLIFWYAHALGDSHAPWLMIIFPIAHVAVGVGLTYTVLCGFLNRTRISIDSSELTIAHGPLPWGGNGRFDRSKIRQLFCELCRSNNNNNFNSTGFTFRLMAVMDDGSKQKVVSGLQDVSDAKFLEQQIERRLGIVDEPVVGEYT